MEDSSLGYNLFLKKPIQVKMSYKKKYEKRSGLLKMSLTSNGLKEFCISGASKG